MINLYDLTQLIIGVIIGSVTTHFLNMRFELKKRRNEAAKNLINEFSPLLNNILKNDVSPYNILLPRYEKQQLVVEYFKGFLDKKRSNELSAIWKLYEGDNSVNTFPLEHLNGGNSYKERKEAREKAIIILKRILEIAGWKDSDLL